jgi:putative oxidoreductase
MTTTVGSTLVLVRILQGIAVLVFVAAGGAKLAGAPQMVAMFAKVGFGQWFRYFTGLLEIAGAVGLLLPGYAFYAALLLAIVMVGAVIAQIAVIAGSPVVPIAMLLLTGLIAYLRKP